MGDTRSLPQALQMGLQANLGSQIGVLNFGDWGLGSRVEGVELKVQDWELVARALGLRVYGLRVWVQFWRGSRDVPAATGLGCSLTFPNWAFIGPRDYKQSCQQLLQEVNGWQ